MNTLLLKKHFENAPRMEPQDAVKLAYQSAFGCGHLLPAQETCARMIETEMAAIAEDENEWPFTLIGNGLCRLNLASPPVRALGAEMIARMMQASDEVVRKRNDNSERFEEALSLVEALAQAGEVRVEAAVEADHQRRARLLDSGKATHDALARQIHRLLAEHGLAGLRATLDEIGMGRSRRADEDGIHVGALGDLLQRRNLSSRRRRQFLCGRRMRIGSSKPLSSCKVVSSDQARAGSDTGSRTRP